MDEFISRVRVTTPNGLVTFDFNDEGVMVGLPCDKQFISWSVWENITRSYGRKPAVQNLHP